MSLIERALNKARETGPAASIPATAGSAGDAEPVRGDTGGSLQAAAGAPVRPPVSRVAENPQLMISESMLSEAGLLAPPAQQRQITAEYRHVKRRLLAEIQAGTASRAVMIASALPGEGKSFSSANLAMSLAMEPDFNVLLIDADVIKPNLTRVFGLAGQPGLMDAAADDSIDVETLIVSTNIEGLSFLPAGRMNPNATEYFASARMQEIFRQLMAVPGRLLVVDTLPLLLTTEARALAPLAGQVLLVVRAESTPRQAVLESLNLLGGDANVKMLLNAAVRTKALAYLGYGYGYGYSYNYGDGDGVSKSGDDVRA